MYTTSVFHYIPRQIVVLLSGYSNRKYMPQYSKPLQLHRGVDNQIQFQFLNQEQKPVDITGKSIICRIINSEGDQILIEKALTLQLPVTGIAALILNAADTENVAPQKAYYTLQIPVGEFDYPVFIDQNAGARGDMNIVNSVLPRFVPSQAVSIPTGQSFPNLSNIPNGISQTYYSSIVNTQDNPILTFQANYTNYVGNVTIQGSTIADGDWYPISVHSYMDVTDTRGYTIRGFHPYIRMQFVSTTGSVTDILAR
jgi:hypothetical protein